MTTELSLGAIQLIRTILSTTGKSSIEPQTLKEIPEPRTLSGQDMSQRRHFFKNTQEVADSILEIRNDLIQEQNEINNRYKEEATALYPTDLPKIKNHLDQNRDLTKELNESFKKTQEISRAKHPINITTQTIETIQDIYAIYAKEKGFITAQDEFAEEIDILAASISQPPQPE